MTQTNTPMSLSVTNNAAEVFAASLAQRGRGIGIRLSVRTAADCSGMAYQLEFVDQAIETDICFEGNGVKLFTDPKSLLYLNGAEVDYAAQPEDEGFVIRNPNVAGACGCGESFYV
jgi:iron-sulfur cluster assembly protein